MPRSAMARSAGDVRARTNSPSGSRFPATVRCVILMAVASDCREDVRLLAAQFACMSERRSRTRASPHQHRRHAVLARLRRRFRDWRDVEDGRADVALTVASAGMKNMSERCGGSPRPGSAESCRSVQCIKASASRAPAIAFRPRPRIPAVNRRARPRHRWGDPRRGRRRRRSRS